MAKTVNDYFDKETQAEIAKLAGQINRGEEVEIKDNIDVDVDKDTTKALNDDVKVDTEKETEAKDMSFKDDPSNKAHAEKRRREEIEELRNQLNAKKQAEANTVEDRVAKKLEELLKEKEVAAQVQKDFETKQNELIEKYDETGEVKYLEEKIRNDLKNEMNVADKPLTKKDIQEMIADTLSKRSEIDQVGLELKQLNDEFGVSFKSFEELMESENGDQIIKYAEDGLSLSDAYLLANKEIIEKRNAIKSNIKNTGRSHMKTTKSGNGSVNMMAEPDDLDMQIMRAFKMDTNKWKEAQKKYNK